jgi:hypothetical protein
MLVRAPFAALSIALMTACSGQIASSGPADGGHGDGSHSENDAGHAMRGDTAVPIDAGHEHDSANVPPANHRPVHVPCPTTRPPGIQDGGGSFGFPAGTCCTSDSQCPATSDAGGTNGRCTPGDLGGEAMCPSCQYDQCSTDTQCGAGAVCECGGDAGPGRYPNTCGTGNCQIDSDCGPSGYCSANVNYCGGSPNGYYCHTPQDECESNSDCASTPNSPGTDCVYDTMKKIWDCQFVACFG